MDFEEAWVDTCSAAGLACRAGNVAALKALLEAGRPVDVADNRGWRPLHEAAHGGHFQCLRLLCNHEDNNVHWKTHDMLSALVLAARAGHAQVCRLLVENGVSLNSTDALVVSPLAAAIMSRQLACVQVLMEAGCDINCQDVEGATPLHLAIDFCLPEIVHCLLKRGADVHKEDCHRRTPIFISAEKGHSVLLRSILSEADKRGVLLNLVDATTLDGTTPLMIAAQKGSVECSRVLVDHGANANVVADDLSMALHLAVFGKSVDCVRLLLERTDRATLRSVSWQPECRRYTLIGVSEECTCSACVSSQNVRPPSLLESITFQSPFHLAVEMGRADVLKCLLDSDLDPNEFLIEHRNYANELLRLMPRYATTNVNRVGITALGLAAKLKDIRAVHMLLRGGCRPNPGVNHVLPALAFATKGNWLNGVKVLLDWGSDPTFPMCLDTCALWCSPQSNLFGGRRCEEIFMELRRAGGDMRRMFSTNCRSATRATSFLEKQLFKTMRLCKRRDDGYDLNSQLLDSFGLKLFDLLRRKHQNELVDQITNTHPPPSLKQMCAIVIRNTILDSRPPFAFLRSIVSLPLPPTLFNYVALRSAV